MITLAQLQGICKTAAGRQAVGKYLDALNRYMPAYGITSKASIAAFLAQIAHESQDFTRVVENLNYSAQGLANTWPNRYAANPKAKAKTPNAVALRLHRNPEAIANNCYANRMGNGGEASGDGWRYRGRSLKQVTGKDNYTACGKALDLDLISHPELLELPENAVRAACWFWKANNLTPLADAGNFTKVTEIINGGTNGLAERQAYYATARRTFV